MILLFYVFWESTYFSSFMPYISQKTDVPLEFKVIEPGTQVMSDIELPTRMVNFGTQGVDQVHALRRNSSSLSLEGVGSVSLFHLENSKYGLLCTKEEITKENNIGELLIFDVRNLRVTCHFIYICIKHCNSNWFEHSKTFRRPKSLSISTFVGKPAWNYFYRWSL